MLDRALRGGGSLSVMTKREQIEKYAREGRKIMAIKAYRDATQLGLRDAKEAVEDFMDRGGWRHEQLVALGEIEEQPAEVAPAAESTKLRMVEVFVQQKQKIPAIKALMELSGYGLRRAKDVVEAYMDSGTWPAELVAPGEANPRLDLSTVEHFVSTGKKIHAIKELRHLVQGIGLKDAKEAVDAYIRDGQWTGSTFGTVGPDLPGHGPSSPNGARYGSPESIEHQLRGVANMLKGGNIRLALTAFSSIPGAEGMDTRREIDLFQRWGNWSKELRTALGLPARDPSSLADTMLPSDVSASPQKPLQSSQASRTTAAASRSAQPSISAAVASLMRSEPE
ncbi:MAG TPA: hypothetical protein ENJ18_02815, partial [Nannocystis exedens]|nr:hypothetical protein [Nannocystis exedens]